MNPRKAERQRNAIPLLCYGLLAAWTVHDLEELVSFRRWKQQSLPRLREQHRLPERLVRRVESTSEREFALTIALVGLPIAAASVAGALSGGRSRFFQLMLAAFGVHSAGHLAGAVAARGYTPGDVTAPLIAAPYSLWAIAYLRAARLWQPFSRQDTVRGAAVALALFAGTHRIARKLVAGP